MLVLGFLFSGIIVACWIFILLNISFDHNTQFKSRTTKAPGARLLAVIDFLFSPKTVEQTFKPLIADWRHEYFEALKQNRKWKARWISARYRFSFINAITLSKVFSLLKQIRSISK